MKINRFFPPIGHGAFYIEKISNENLLDNIVIVYDCGSTNIAALKKEIEDLDIEKIDILFISHFDDDHVNGIASLCKRYNIKNVVMPDINDIKIIYLAKAISVHSSMDTLQLIKDPFNFFASRLETEPGIYFISPVEGEQESEYINEIRYLSSGTNIVSVILPGLELLNWALVPHNYNKEVNAEMIKTQIETVLINEYGQTAIDEQYIIEHMEDLKGTFNNIFKNYNKGLIGDSNCSNVNSLVLYSGPLKKETCKIIYNNTYKYLENREKRSGFLYCGDYNAKDCTSFKQLNDFMDKYIEFIGGIQIPHHGSKYNYNSMLANNNRICVVSVGVMSGKHKCKFPNEEVAEDILVDSYLIQITDQIWTRFKQEITI